MKKAAFLLIILSLMRIGVVYADAAGDSSKNQDYFFGVKNATSNFNQVLALLIGPAGIPGPAGVAGKDGLIGMNGEPGLPGAPGAAGRDGVGILAASFTGAQGTCTDGGTRFVDAAGNITYACNGTGGGGVGPQGPPGPPGPEGPAGTGSGGSTGYGTGTLAAGSCEEDNSIYLNLDYKFTGERFVYDKIFMGKPSEGDADINSSCASQEFTLRLTVRTPTAPDVIVGDSSDYVAGDSIVCTTTLPSAAGWPTSSPQFTFESSDMSCTSATSRALTPSAQFGLNDIDTADTTNVIGFELGN
jgi:hypothetical protein